MFIAFAGFAGVITAFSTIRLSPEVTAFRVRSLVSVALLALFAALLPFLPEEFGASGISAIRVAGIPVAVGTIGHSVWIWRQSLPLYKSGALNTQFYAILDYVVAAILAAAMIAVSAGLLTKLASAIYLSTLFFGLALCCYYFVLVILAVDLRSRS